MHVCGHAILQLSLYQQHEMQHLIKYYRVPDMLAHIRCNVQLEWPIFVGPKTQMSCNF